MRNPPMDKRLLNGKIKWYRNRLVDSENNDGTEIDHVRCEPGYVVDEGGSQQSGYNQWIVYWDERYSTHDSDGNIPKFAVGDSVKIITGPINGFPKLMKIIWVWMDYDADQSNVHHIRLLLR